MHTIVLLGNFGATNIGDEALLESMLHLFRLEEGPESLRLHVMTSDPADTLHRYEEKYHISASPLFPAGFRSLPRLGSCLKALRALGPIDHVIFGGGGLFTDQQSTYPVILWWIQLQGLRLVTKAPVHIVGQSFGPLKTRLGRRLKSQVLRHVASIAVRDASSVALSKELHSEKDALHLPDLAFFYPLQEATALEPHKGLRVAVSLRPWQDTAGWIDAIEAWVRDAKKPLELLLVPMQTTREEDVSILAALQHRLKDMEGVTAKIQYVTSFGDLATTLRGCDLVVGQRLHFLLCALMVGTPAVGLAYSDKVRSLLRDSGVQLLETPDADLAVAAKEAMKAASKKRLAEFHQETQQHKETISSLLHGRPVNN